MNDSRAVAELIGVYDADGGVVGELRYVVRHLLGRAECSLCDITHSGVRRKAEFDELREHYGVPFELVHRNERSDELAAATGDAIPCVVARAEAGFVALLGADELRACAGAVERFGRALDAALAAKGLTTA